MIASMCAGLSEEGAFAGGGDEAAVTVMYAKISSNSPISCGYIARDDVDYLT